MHNEEFMKLVTGDVFRATYEYWPEKLLCPLATFALQVDTAASHKDGRANIARSYGRNNEFGPAWNNPSVRSIKLGSIRNPSGKLDFMDATGWNPEYSHAVSSSYYTKNGEGTIMGVAYPPQPQGQCVVLRRPRAGRACGERADHLREVRSSGQPGLRRYLLQALESPGWKTVKTGGMK